MLKHSHKKNNNNLIIIVTVVAVLFIGALIWIVKANSKTAPTTGANSTQIESLAQCLSEKGMKMYGASRCPHCKAQKAMFGVSFSKVDYVECTTDAVKCNIAGVSGYPTWIYQGQKYEGEQTFEELAKITGCTYSGPETTIS